LVAALADLAYRLRRVAPVGYYSRLQETCAVRSLLRRRMWGGESSLARGEALVLAAADVPLAFSSSALARARPAFASRSCPGGERPLVRPGQVDAFRRQRRAGGGRLRGGRGDLGRARAGARTRRGHRPGRGNRQG